MMYGEVIMQHGTESKHRLIFWHGEGMNHFDRLRSQ